MAGPETEESKAEKEKICPRIWAEAGSLIWIIDLGKKRRGRELKNKKLNEVVKNQKSDYE